MKNKKKVITAVVTPFKKDGEIDLEAFKKLLKFLKAQGTDGVVVCGSTGEAATLSDDEKIELFLVASAFRSKDFEIIAGVGSNDTHHVLSLLEKIENIAVDSVLIVSPYYNKPTQEGMFEHFRLIAEHSAFPVILYEIPGRTSVSISIETLKKLSKVKNIAGIKESNPDLQRIFKIKNLIPHWLVYSGDDPAYLPSLSLGADGIISVVSHLIPKTLIKIGDSYLKGNMKATLNLQEEVVRVCDKIFQVTNPIGVKAALASEKKIENILRLPLVSVPYSKL